MVSHKKIIPLAFVIFFFVNSIYSTPAIANQGSAEAQISSAKNLETTLKQTTLNTTSLDFITMALSLIASIGIMCSGIAIWVVFKRKEMNPNGHQQYSAFLLVITAVLALFVASPVLENLDLVPQTEYLTEFSFLGPYHNATYPFNIRLGEKYALYLNVANHLGNCSYYNIEIKFRNHTQSLPDSIAKTASDQPVLGRLSIFVADKESLELPVEVSFEYQLHEDNSKLYMEQVYLNGDPLIIDTIIEWDSQREGFFGNLFFELWNSDDELGKFNYHQRYISLSLKFNV